MSQQCSLTQFSKHHFNSCCQHQITYFISCPVKHYKATCRISFASLVQPCLSQRLACSPTDNFNYGQISDRFAVDSPHKSKSRDGCLAARSLELSRFTSSNMSEGERTCSRSFFCQSVLAFSISIKECRHKRCLLWELWCWQ